VVILPHFLDFYKKQFEERKKVAKQLKDINLLKAYEVANKPKEGSTRLFILLIILELTLALFFFSMYVTKTVSLSNENVRIKDEIKQKEVMLKELEVTYKKKNLLDKKKEAYDVIVSRHLKYLKILDNIENLSPQNLTFENINLSLDKLTMTVRAPNAQTVTQFVYNIQNSSFFSNITFNSVNGPENAKTSTITADIVGK